MENKNDAICAPEDAQEQEKPTKTSNATNKAIDLSKGALQLSQPIRARGVDVTELKYDFSKITGWEYAEVMDSDKDASGFSVFTRKQCLRIFALAVEKAMPEMMDRHDVMERIGLADSMTAINIGGFFIVASAKEAGKNTYAS